MGSYHAFDQTEFFGESANPTGNIYIPEACKEAEAHCKVLFVFHGCGRKITSVHNSNGFSNIGALNEVIVVYPGTNCWGTDENDPDVNTLSDGIIAMADRLTQEYDCQLD